MVMRRLLLLLELCFSQRVRWLFIGTFFLCLLCPKLCLGQSSVPDRPNIVFAFADDWGQHASVYGELKPGGINDLASTPNFDRIAKQGVLFTQAFVSAPSCTPCRSSLFSGRNFWETGRGAILRGAVWDAAIPTFPLLLKKHGYHIGFSNKAWSPGVPRDAPFGGNQHRYNSGGGSFNGFSQFLNKNRDDLVAAKQKLTDEVKENFARFLAERNSGQPYLYFWGPTNVHRNWIAGSGKEFWGLEPDKLNGKLPAFLPDVELVRQDVADYLGEVQAFDLGLGALMEELESRGELDNTIVIVSGDHGAAGFPNGKCSLYDFGTQVPLAVRMPGGKNGGRVLNDLVSIPDLAPTILELCNADVPSSMSAKSLVPSLTSELEGWVDQSREFVVTGRERHVAEARDGFKPYPQRAIRTREFLLIRNYQPDRWPMGKGPEVDCQESELPTLDRLQKNTRAAWADFDASPTKAWIAHHCRTPERQKYFQFAFGKRPARELYRLADDPDQVKNLADDPEYKATLLKLENQLEEYLISTRDPRLTGDRLTFEKSPFTDGPGTKNRK